MQKKHFGLFLALVIISVLLMAYQSWRGPLKPLWFISTALNNINSSLTIAHDKITDTHLAFFIRQRELEQLRQEVRRLRLRELRHKEVLEENLRLRELLSLGTPESPRNTVARVISRGSDRFASTLVINKGTDAFIQKDMTVVTPDGLLGKVFKTTPSSSVVMVLDDASFSVAVRFQDQRTEAILTGVGQGRCNVKYFDADREVLLGEVLVTSGLDELFPPGIPVGTISDVETQDKELFHRIEAIPFVDVHRVEEVIVLLQ